MRTPRDAIEHLRVISGLLTVFDRVCKDARILRRVGSKNELLLIECAVSAKLELDFLKHVSLRFRRTKLKFLYLKALRVLVWPM